MKPFLSRGLEPVDFGFLLSGMMSFIVSGLSTYLSIGLSSALAFSWLKAWLLLAKGVVGVLDTCLSNRSADRTAGQVDSRPNRYSRLKSSGSH